MTGCLYPTCNAILAGLAAMGKSMVQKKNYECPKALGISKHQCNLKRTP